MQLLLGVYSRGKHIYMYLLYSGLSEGIESVTVVESGENLCEFTQ